MEDSDDDHPIRFDTIINAERESLHRRFANVAGNDGIPIWLVRNRVQDLLDLGYEIGTQPGELRLVSCSGVVELRLGSTTNDER